ncbi:CBS domain-containing protein [Coprinopsis cinerea AmutBmut pab1-1]|nr:CBS domain-containing protein [Coprinopsis cinerea AmutBmut pab1-1]
MKSKLIALAALIQLATATPYSRQPSAHPFTFIPHGGGGSDHPAEPGSSTFWEKVFVSVALVLIGGVFAGLTLGLMGLDELHLRVLSASSDDPKEKKNAQKVLKLLEKGRHWVLIVLLLGNVIVNSTLPLFLDSALGGGLAAVVVSTFAIVIFGEVIPQAICVRYGLSIGAACAPLVLAMMYIFAPIAWPLAKLLDWALGKHDHHTYKKAELKSFLQFHRTGEEPLRDDEIAILNGVLELNTKKVEQIMTPMKDTVILSADTVLDHSAVDAILTSGYSRFPVHEPGNPLAFMGTLLIKKLLTYDPAKALPVSSFPLTILPEAHPTINCFQALDYFQTGRAHLLLISRTPGQAGGAIGVITLEDIIEEIISEEIVDETDRYEDNRSKRQARRVTTASIMRGIVERERRRGESSERSALLGGGINIGSQTNSLEVRGYGSIPEGISQSPTAHEDEDLQRTPKNSHIKFTYSESPKGL